MVYIIEMVKRYHVTFWPYVNIVSHVVSDLVMLVYGSSIVSLYFFVVCIIDGGM